MKYFTITLFILFTLNSLTLNAASRSVQPPTNQKEFVKKKSVTKKKRRSHFLQKLKNIFSKKKFKKVQNRSRFRSYFGLFGIFLVAASLIALLMDGLGFILFTLPIIFLLSLFGLGMDGDKTMAVIALIYCLIWVSLIVLVFISCRNGCL